MLPRAPNRKRLRLIALGVSALLVLTILFVLSMRTKSFLPSNPHLARGRMANIPPVILWAWERPEQFDFINPRDTGVAFLARTIYLRDERVVVRPRLQPLDVPPGTVLIAVARIETGRDEQKTHTAAQLAETIEAVAELSRTPGVAGIQIDFDATDSERDFYRALLQDLRRKMPERMPLIITALASWCTHDDWLDDAPVDEAVPMLFRMGVDRQLINNFLKTGQQFSPRVCRTSLGISTDEAVSAPPSVNPRLYIFHTRSWTETIARTTLERYRNAN